MPGSTLLRWVRGNHDFDDDDDHDNDNDDDHDDNDDAHGDYVSTL